MIIVRLVNHDDGLSKAILLKTGGEYAHDEAITPQGTIIGAFALGGVQERMLDYDNSKFKKELLLALTASDEISDKFYHYLKACLNESYAFKDIAGFLYPFDHHDQHHVFCSALIQDALRGSGWFPRPVPIPAHCVYPVLLQQMIFARAEGDFKIINRDELKCFTM